MDHPIHRSRFHWSFRLLALELIGILLVTLPAPYVAAQTSAQMPPPGVRVSLSPAFTPPLIRGITIHPENPLAFDFLMTTGDDHLTPADKTAEYERLIKYFLAALTVPEQDMWVNLSPYEQNRVISETFGKTEMGRDLLAQDYLLKQITASVIYPEEEMGKRFWDNVYRQAQEQFHTTDIPVNTFNKVWIVPDDAVVYEHGNSAFVLYTHLKVMLEEDYVALSHQKDSAESRSPDRDVALSHQKDPASPEGNAQGFAGVTPASQDSDVNQVGAKVVREIVIPALEKEVNEGKNFALLRQAFQSACLAAWFKKTLRDSLLGKVYADQGKVKGVDQKDVAENQKIYEQYVAAYKKGVFNYIKEENDPITQEIIPRKYFSGGATTILNGIKWQDRIKNVKNVSDVPDKAMLGLTSLESITDGDITKVDLRTPDEGLGEDAQRIGSTGEEAVRQESTPIVDDRHQPAGEFSQTTNNSPDTAMLGDRKSQLNRIEQLHGEIASAILSLGRQKPYESEFLHAVLKPLSHLSSYWYSLSLKLNKDKYDQSKADLERISSFLDEYGQLSADPQELKKQLEGLQNEANAIIKKYTSAEYQEQIKKELEHSKASLDEREYKKLEDQRWSTVQRVIGLNKFIAEGSFDEEMAAKMREARKVFNAKYTEIMRILDTFPENQENVDSIPPSAGPDAAMLVELKAGENVEISREQLQSQRKIHFSFSDSSLGEDDERVGFSVRPSLVPGGVALFDFVNGPFLIQGIKDEHRAWITEGSDHVQVMTLRNGETMEVGWDQTIYNAGKIKHYALRKDGKIYSYDFDSQSPSSLSHYLQIDEAFQKGFVPTWTIKNDNGRLMISVQSAVSGQPLLRIASDAAMLSDIKQLKSDLTKAIRKSSSAHMTRSTLDPSVGDSIRDAGETLQRVREALKSYPSSSALLSFLQDVSGASLWNVNEDELDRLWSEFGDEGSRRSSDAAMLAGDENEKADTGEEAVKFEPAPIVDDRTQPAGELSEKASDSTDAAMLAKVERVSAKAIQLENDVRRQFEDIQVLDGKVALHGKSYPVSEVLTLLMEMEKGAQVYTNEIGNYRLRFSYPVWSGESETSFDVEIPQRLEDVANYILGVLGARFLPREGRYFFPRKENAKTSEAIKTLLLTLARAIVQDYTGDRRQTGQRVITFSNKYQTSDSDTVLRIVDKLISPLWKTVEEGGTHNMSYESVQPSQKDAQYLLIFEAIMNELNDLDRYGIMTQKEAEPWQWNVKSNTWYTIHTNEPGRNALSFPKLLLGLLKFKVELLHKLEPDSSARVVDERLIALIKGMDRYELEHLEDEFWDVKFISDSEKKKLLGVIKRALAQRPEPPSSDAAMLGRGTRDEDVQRPTSNVLRENPGGIDIGHIEQKMQIRRDGRGIALPVELQDVEHINIDGFVPHIIDITPASDIPLLLGLSDQPSGSSPVASSFEPPVIGLARKP